MTDDADDITDEEAAEISAFVGRYPTFHLINRLLNSHARLERFLSMRAPATVVMDEIRLRDKIIRRLVEVFPARAEGEPPIPGYHLRDVVEQLQRELEHSPKTGSEKGETPGVVASPEGLWFLGSAWGCLARPRHRLPPQRLFPALSAEGPRLDVGPGPRRGGCLET